MIISNEDMEWLSIGWSTVDCCFLMSSPLSLYKVLQFVFAATQQAKKEKQLLLL